LFNIIENFHIYRPLTEKRGAANDDVGDDSSGVGTPSSSRRLSRRQRKNNRKREKEDKVWSFNNKKINLRFVLFNCFSLGQIIEQALC
jgi:hypothetical protein